MSNADRKEIKAAWLLAVKANNLVPSQLMKLHKKPRHIVDKWLYVTDRHPDFQAAYELWRLIRSLKGTMPIELARLINRSNNRVDEFIRDLDKNIITGSLRYKLAAFINDIGIKATLFHLGYTYNLDLRMSYKLNKNVNLTNKIYYENYEGKKYLTNSLGVEISL